MENAKAILSLSGYEFKIIELLKRAIKIFPTWTDCLFK